MTNQKQDEQNTDVTQLQLFAQTCQKLADRCQRAHRDETNPPALRWRMYGSSEAYSLMAMIFREWSAQQTLKAPPNDIGVLEQMYKMLIDMSKQNE